MAYDETLARRVREALAGHEAVSERKMFGGIAFMLGGNMCCGVIGTDLLVRVGPDRFDEALSLPHARPMDFSGRSMTGFVYVGPAGCRADAALAEWVERAVTFAGTLPPK